MASLEGCEAKLSRAHEHLQALEKHIGDWFTGEHYAFVHEVCPDSPSQYQVRTTRIDPLPPTDFALVIGDILHNIRSALDHLAYALSDANVTATNSGQEFERGSEFPIFGDEDRRGNFGAGPGLFQKDRLRKIGAMTQAAQIIIEGLQPYQRGNDFRLHPLWHLHELSNVDKHRLLHPVIHQFFGMMIRADGKDIEVRGNVRVSTGSVENNAILAVYDACNRGIHDNFSPTFQIVFDQTTCVPGRDIIDALAAIYNYVVSDVVPPLEQFLV